MSDDAASTESTEAAEPAQEAKETFGLEYVQQLRAEAAKYRSERKSAVEEAKAATAAEFTKKLDEAGSKYTELEQSKAAAELEILKYRTVLESEVPSELVLDLVALAQGYDEETISESVQKLKTIMGQQSRDRAVDTSQGSGNVLPLNGDPLLDTVRRMVGA